MKKVFLIIAVIFSLNSTSSFARDWVKLNIFACTPEWSSLALEITGDKANIFSAIGANQDPHYMKPNSALELQISKSDIVFCTGADLEKNWLPALLAKSPDKSRIQKGGEGYFMASDYVAKLEVPKLGEIVDSKNIHPLGNPHIHLNPRNISIVAAKFTELLKKLDPDNAVNYQKNYNNFAVKWNKAISKWEKDALDSNLKDLKIVARHDQWVYLTNWLKIDQNAVLEEEPGVAANNEYIANLLQTLGKKPIDMIIYAPFEDKKIILWIRVKIKAPDVMMPFTIGGHPKVNNLFDLFDYTINSLKIHKRVQKSKTDDLFSYPTINKDFAPQTVVNPPKINTDQK